MTAYHDVEWGVPVHDDRVLFEFLILEGAQAGLSWETVLRKRERCLAHACIIYQPPRPRGRVQVIRIPPRRIQPDANLWTKAVDRCLIAIPPSSMHGGGSTSPCPVALRTPLGVDIRHGPQ
jgi:hypothetical protein